MKRINFETAKLAKEAGYKIKSDSVYEANTEWLTNWHNIELRGNIYQAPYQAELQSWLRNVHGIHIIVGYKYIPNYSASPRYGKPTFECEIQVFKQTFKEGVFEGEDGIIHVQDKSGLSFDTYEDALETGLMEGLKIVIDAK